METEHLLTAMKMAQNTERELGTELDRVDEDEDTTFCPQSSQQVDVMKAKLKTKNKYLTQIVTNLKQVTTQMLTKNENSTSKLKRQINDLTKKRLELE